MPRWIIAALGLLGLLALGACNTAEGIGKDLESVGETISEEAGDED